MVGRRTKAWAGAALLAGVFGALGALTLPQAARATTPLYNGDFHAGADGWVTSNATLTVEQDSAGPIAHLAAAGPGTFLLRSQWWLATAVPGGEYQLAATLRADDPALGSARIRLAFLDAAGVEVTTTASTAALGGVTFEHVVAPPAVAPPGTHHVQVVVIGDAHAPDAALSIRNVTLDVTLPAAPAPTVQPPPPTATPAPGTPTASATPRPTTTPRPTATPRPPASAALRNATFDDGAVGWDVVGGEVTTAAVLGDAFGHSMVLRAHGGNSVWVHQLVSVVPGQWYDASAVLAPLEHVRFAWLRVAWYASPTGEGAQLSTVDSPQVASPPPLARAEAIAQISTGPVQAPATAQSARVRIVLQPAGAAGAAVAIDDVSMIATLPPPPPAATPTATPPAPPATPAASATTAPSPTAATASPVATPASRTPSSIPAQQQPQPAAAPGQHLLRITELLPDPIEEGRDAPYEWVEITNFGPTATTLAGMALRDNAATTTLPTLAVPAGASVVIAGSLATVAADVRLPVGIGNGLGNNGDRLELLDATGAVVDALAYGSADPPAGVVPVPAPPPGQTIARTFDVSGRYLHATIGAPTPGRYAPAPAPTAVPSPDAAGSADAATAAAASIAGAADAPHRGCRSCFRPRRRLAPAACHRRRSARRRRGAAAHPPLAEAAGSMEREGAAMPHTILLAQPRGFCAGVVRAIDVLDQILDRDPGPVYAFHEIVHNRYVVDSFRQRGTVFVDTVGEIPEGSRVVFSAHGVSPAVVEEAKQRRLNIIDATCPLVTKVHLETRKAAKDGFDILLVGHEGHDEVEGTKGEAPERTRVVDRPVDVQALADPQRPVFVVTQTTLSVDDTADTIQAIRDRFPDAQIRNDICYATTNRQAAVKELARRAGLVIVVGSANSSNSVRLCEVARSLGTPAHRVDGIEEIDPAWYEGVDVVGLTAGASVPDDLLEPIIQDLRQRGVSTVEPVVVATETVEFRLPEELTLGPA